MPTRRAALVHTSALSIGAAVALALSAPSAQAPAPAPSGVVRLDPALDAIVSASGKVETLKGDYFGIAEGPLWVPDGGSGYLLLSDIAANVVYKRAPDGQLSVYLERSGYTGTDFSKMPIFSNGRLNIANFGSNGLAFDPQGRLVLTAQGDRAIVQIERDGTRTVLADRFEGKRFNSPNDLVIKSNGTVYFTDPTAVLRGGNDSPEKELPFNAAFLVKDGRVEVVQREFTPNGIALSPDERILYVNGGGRIFRYFVQPDDSAVNGELFVDMTSDKAPGGTDGMKVDQRGNVYSSGPGGIWILSSSGKLLGKILTPERVTNLTFGDPDRRTLYITSQRSLFRIRLNAPGSRPES
jgi:gluconolactonase